MSTLREMVSPKSDTTRWIAAPAGFICDSCHTPQEKGTLISSSFHGSSAWERGEWEWDAPDCTQCEIESRAKYEIDKMRTLAKSRSSELDFNDYTQEYWERQAASPVPTEFGKLVQWVANRYDLMEYQKILAKLRLEDEIPGRWSLYYLTENGEIYDGREEVDFYKSLRFADLPEKPELSVWDQVALAAVREIDPNHPIVTWLG